jgi:CBS domain-containing protein
MIATHLISENIIPLKSSDTGSIGLKWMDENKVSHLPIVNGDHYVGLISEKDILDNNKFDQALGNHRLSLDNVCINEKQHIYEIIEMLEKYSLSLVAVVNKDEKYLGVITLKDLLKYLSSSFSVNSPGGVIVLEMSQNNYSLTEIANIVESNGAKVLSCFLGNHSNSTLIEVIIKINRVEMDSILQTFARYNYSVMATFGKNENVEDLKDRYDSLMNYLNI